MTPLELGTPLRLGSRAMACLNERARALVAASALWWSLLPYSTSMWTFACSEVARDSKKWLMSSVGMFSTFLPLSFRSILKYGRLTKSTAANAKEQSIGAAALPNRVMPSRVPKALLNASPKPMAKSSTIWCTKSPLTEAVMSIRLCVAKEVSMWSRKGTPEFMLAFPSPSRFTFTLTSVSLVFR